MSMNYKLIGYGSLISHKKWAQYATHKHHFKQVLVKGYKRIFDIKYHGGDVLNVEKSVGHHFNAVMFTITPEELANLKRRESGYNLELCCVHDFKTGKKIGKGYLFIDYINAIEHHKKARPLKEYFKVCREAAYHISKKFGKEWDKTTYTADNEQIYSWLKNNKSFDSIR